jgi:hypothetical protein
MVGGANSQAAAATAAVEDLDPAEAKLLDWGTEGSEHPIDGELYFVPFGGCGAIGMNMLVP